MDRIALPDKMVLYHIRDTTLSAGPRRVRPRFNLGLPIGILLVIVALLYFGARGAA